MPFPIVEAGKYKGEWKYAVASEPKTEIKGEKPTPTPYTPHARTGDDSEAFKYANAGIIGVMLLIAFIVIANLIYNKKKKKA